MEYCLDLHPTQIEESFVCLEYDQFFDKLKEIILDTLAKTSPEITCNIFKISPSLLTQILTNSSSVHSADIRWNRSFQSIFSTDQLPQKRKPSELKFLPDLTQSTKLKRNRITTTHDFLSSASSSLSKKKKCTYVREIEQDLIKTMIQEVNETHNLPRVADKFNIKRDSLKWWYNKYYEDRLTDEVHWQEEQVSDTIYKAFKEIEEEILTENDKIGFQRYRTHTIINQFH